jgi:two-component system nitrate/nitrite sensor histidine kinase NarX
LENLPDFQDSQHTEQRLDFSGKIWPVNIRTGLSRLKEYPNRLRLPVIAVFVLVLVIFWTGLPYLLSEVLDQRVLIFWLSVSLAALAALLTDLFVRLRQDRLRLLTQVSQVQKQADDTSQRLATVFHLSKKFVEANDEAEIITQLLKISIDLVGARGASFVPIDERGQPIAAVSQGELPFPALDAWVEYLASPTIRQRCNACENHGRVMTVCPLLNGPYADVIGLYCLPLKMGDREIGVLNLYMPDSDGLDAGGQEFLMAMLDETALALESVRLRQRELAALRQMQSVRRKTDLKGVLTGLLADVQSNLESDFARLEINETHSKTSPLIVGSFPDQLQPFLEGIAQGVRVSGEPVLLGDVTGSPASSPAVRSLMAVPLISSKGEPFGVLLVGNRRSQSFHTRQLTLLQTICDQAAMVIENASLLAELEYKTVIQERTRLAREIHDGLAQTLGFLKLQTSQMGNYLNRGETERLRQTLQLCYATLSDAYQDARLAIDGLRINSSEQGLRGWLEQAVVEFRELTETEVLLEEVDVRVDLPPEIHAQLIRIVQEALNNVRKHAQANRVQVSCQQSGEDLWLEIRDDGIGFSPLDVPELSRYGLRGMRERAELMGADFQVISRPNDGTAVRVRLPLVAVDRYAGFGQEEVNG